MKNIHQSFGGAAIVHVFISKGHLPGKDPGAVYGEQKEIDKISSFSNTLQDITLNGKGEGMLGTKTKMVFVPWVALKDRIAFINNYIKTNNLDGANCLAIEIHFDVASDDLIQKFPLYAGIYYGSKKGEELAKNYLSLFDDVTDFSNKVRTWVLDHKTARQGRLGFVADTACPALLLEAGYVKGDAEKSSHALVTLLKFLQ